MWVGVATAGGLGAADQSAAGPQTERATPSPQRATIDRYCVSCHNTRLKTADLALDSLDLAAVGEHPEVWEKVVRKLRGGLMPPAGRPRPDQATQDGLVAWLENAARHRGGGAARIRAGPKRSIV